jgi:hypothetical protein
MAQAGARLMKLWGGRRGSKPASDRGKAAPALSPGARLPTDAETAEMAALLDRMLFDEQILREHGHNAIIPPLYRADVVATMEATIAGILIDPNAMFGAMDLLDAHHALAQAADKGTHHFHAAQQALMSLAQDNA